jgi:hypothetical protein
MNSRLLLIVGLAIVGVLLLALGAGVLAYGSPREFFQVFGVGIE